MLSHGDTEEGQAMIEFALVFSVLSFLTIGLIYFALAFYQYNALSQAARDAARWGSVQGGTCLSKGADTTADFCDQNTTVPAGYNFWNTAGNQPLQTGAGVSCVDASGNAQLAYYYAASSYSSPNNTTIVGTVAHRLDSSTSSSFVSLGSASPGLNLSKAKVCVQLNGSTYASSGWSVQKGDSVAVYVYYPATAGTFLNTLFTPGPLLSSSHYIVE